MFLETLSAYRYLCFIFFMCTECQSAILNKTLVQKAKLYLNLAII